MQLVKKQIVATATDFIDNLPPPVRDALQPVDYVYLMLANQSIILLAK